MENRPISFRPSKSVQAALDQEQARSNYTLDTTACLTRLVERGAGMLEPIYVVSGVSRLREIEALREEVRAFLRRLDEIKQRLGGPLNPEIYKDGERKLNVAKWRKMSEDMAPELQALLVRISNMADLLLGGWTPKEYDDLVTLQGFLKIKLIENPSTRPEDKVVFESAAKALEKFMGPYIG